MLQSFHVTVGWFDAAETTTVYSPLVLNISVDVDGREYKLDTVYSPDRELSLQKRSMWVPSKKMKALADKEAIPIVEAALHAANQRLVRLITSDAKP